MKIERYGRRRIGILTPRHRLRQLEPSLFFKGQTTSLLASVTEKELVSELLGGMVHVVFFLVPRGGEGEVKARSGMEGDGREKVRREERRERE